MTSTGSQSDTPMTPNGKVSKAKKGKPVHVCSECQKVYTRAEHLRLVPPYPTTRDGDANSTIDGIKLHMKNHNTNVKFANGVFIVEIY